MQSVSRAIWTAHRRGAEERCRRRRQIRCAGFVLAARNKIRAAVAEMRSAILDMCESEKTQHIKAADPGQLPF